MNLPTRLSFLFGSEEYVSLRRQLVFLREWLLNHQVPQNQVHTICSGSLGEGVAYPKSDDDVMIYRTDIRVVKTYREATQRGDLLMVPSEYSPGYCLLLDAKGSYPDNYIQNINGISFLSSLLMKESYVGEGMSIHGPCHSGNYGPEEYDFAHCIPCFDWPDVANDWILRNRSNDWPSCEIVENIIQNGCHVVPVGDSTSPHGNHEWRMSFSVGERTLMHSFNHVQFLVYNLLRLTLKTNYRKDCS
ncbi:hypothetical protein FSP39_020849 [Pinctada imbricata]|uniref:Mab-21-like nucleotidyltransferase domain-containing protein n=1 Tax=Pinctada imbricata TaxID=66713 RepID=A0AA88YRF0_PINIB|nr:hypothetical protein FSP39_020849 [Pinctada imbricata]